MFADVSKTESDWTAADYYDCGDDVADILVQALGKPSEAEDIDIDWDLLREHLNPLF